MRDGNRPPNRRSVRLRGYDYSGPGTIFFTMCVDGWLCRFGFVRDKVMHRNRLGEIVQAEWEQTLVIRPELICHAFVVMPNHVHGLITIDPPVNTQSNVATAGARADCHLPLHARKKPRSMATLATGFKGAVTRQAEATGYQLGDDLWQRGFHEHVVRTEQRFDAIKAYIEDNPARWHEDRFYSDSIADPDPDL